MPLRLSVINGDRPGPVPMALGHKATGEVMELGEGVTDLAVGDHVGLLFAQASTCRCSTSWFDLLIANQEDLGRLMTAEQGKLFAETKGEVAYAASFVEWFAEEAKRVNGEHLPQFDNNRRLLVAEQPLIGVCAAITPWSFLLAMWRCGVAVSRAVVGELSKDDAVIFGVDPVTTCMRIERTMHDHMAPWWSGAFHTCPPTVSTTQSGSGETGTAAIHDLKGFPCHP